MSNRKRLRVLIYVRVSTKKQTNLNQFMALRKAAKFHDWDVIGVFKDWGFSGKNTQRQGFQNLVEAIHRRNVDLVAVWSLSRIGRNLKDLIYFTDEVLRPSAVNLYSMTEDINTSTPAGRAFFHILAAFTQYERESTVEKVLEGLERARAQGKTLGRPSIDCPSSKQYKPDLITNVLALKRTSTPLKVIAKKVGCGVGTVYKILEAHAPEELPRKRAAD